jgi:hypothetical protein
VENSKPIPSAPSLASVPELAQQLQYDMPLLVHKSF